MPARVFTVGHGNRTSIDLLGLLEAVGIETLVDVRRYPSSRRNPQFNAPILKNSLRSAGIQYLWEGDALGGRRETSGDDIHTALESPAMQSYAAHMQGESFRESAWRAVQWAETAPTVMMCAELRPTCCHRSLISDYLTLNGTTVHHLIEPGTVIDHCVHPQARLDGECVIYDRRTQLNFDL